jgi:hypothetical protein
MPLSAKSLAHNQKVVREYGARWAKKILKPTSFKARRKAAKQVAIEPPLKRVSLWMDSSDFPITGKHKVSISIAFLKSCLNRKLNDHSVEQPRPTAGRSS